MAGDRAALIEADAAPGVRLGAPAEAAPGAQALSESAARALLADAFRAAGFRVRYDVPVARDGAFALTVDGYDPMRRVGFEYVAEEERGAELDAGERSLLARDPEQRVLVIDAVDAAGLEERAQRFLRDLGPRE